MESVYDITKSAETPFVVKEKIDKWQLFKYKESDWCSLFPTENIFRKGEKKFSPMPMWERSCSNETMNMSKFFNVSKGNESNFLYFDYKPLKDLFCENHPILESINWADLGVPPDLSQDPTLWIGNCGAHTPCHMDTYGNNLVAQLYGRKRWLLIPPKETPKMKPSRVPYEESSVYSLFNFFTPTSQILDISEIYEVTLEPGDVLFVPRHWWHYVENLEVSISVNIWMPSHKDVNSRLEEALVKKYIWSICQDLTIDESREILNPNEDTLLTSQIQDEILQQVVMECAEDTNLEENMFKQPINKKKRLEHVYFLTRSPKDEIQKYIESKASVFNYDWKKTEYKNMDLNNQLNVCKALINSMCHPDTIRLASEKFLQQLKN